MAFEMTSKAPNFQIAPGLLVKRGTVIEMPLVPCHLSPEYFLEPEKFDPERFLKGNADNIIPFSYRPFGGESNRIWLITYCIYEESKRVICLKIELK